MNDLKNASFMQRGSKRLVLKIINQKGIYLPYFGIEYGCVATKEERAIRFYGVTAEVYECN